MKPSVSTWSAHEWLLNKKMSFEDFCDLIRENGAEGVEIVDIDLYDTSLGQLIRMKEAARVRGLEITCMSLEHNLCRITAEARAQDVRRVKDWMDKAKALDVPRVRVFTGWALRWRPYPVEVEWVYTGLREIAAYAEEIGIDLVLENHNNICMSSSELQELFRCIDSPRLYTCPDIFNYAYFDDETGRIPTIDEWSYDEIRPQLKMARNAHIKICEAVSDRQDKYMDVERMFAMLRDDGYDGPVALEFMWPILDDDKDFCTELAKAVRVVVNNAKA